MRKLICLIALMSVYFAQAQTDGGVGLKAGVNYGSTGDLSQDGQTIIDNPDEKIGFHVGVFGKIDLGAIYIRPELMYTQLNSEYNGLGFEVNKLDAPVLVGVNIIGPLHIFAGPSVQYILDTDLEDVDIDDVEEDFTIGAQFGVGVNLGNLGIDVRYERGFTENEAEFTNVGSLGTLDTRPSQIILGLSLTL